MRSRQPGSRLATAVVALCTAAVLLWPAPARALDPSLDITQYAHLAWTFRNGFANGAVYTIAQTSDGYLWLGTASGVVRYDGARVTPLPLRAGRQLPNAAAGALLAARDGTLWIGTLDGLVSWKNGELTAYQEFARRTVITLLQHRDGTVWAGSFGGATGRLCAFRGEHATCYGDDGKLGASVASLYEDGDGSLWVGAATGLWRWTPGAPAPYLSTPIQTHQSLTQGDRGRGVLVAVDGVRQVAGTEVVDYPLRGVPSPLTATSVLRDRNGGLWIGTAAHGLAHSYEGRTSRFTHEDGLSSDEVLALFEDREGTIWVGTSEGIDRFREWPVTPLSVKQGLSNSNATSVLAARDGSIWIGTADGLNRWKDGHTTIYRRRNNPGLPDDSIQSLFEDERGRIWVSGSRGLAAFENGKFTAVPAVPGGFTHAIASDDRGGLWLSLWLTANDYGLAHLVEGKIIEHAPWQKLGGGPGTGLVPDPDGGVWTGLLSGGVAHFRAGQIRNLSLTSDGAGIARKVLDVSRDHDGTIWVATDSGLSRITNGRVATLTTANGLPCNTVHWIIEDQLASYWLYTACGLVRIARTELDAWTADPARTIRSTMTFDSADGIRLLPILRPMRPAVTKSSDGKIWFVNGATVSVIDPSRAGINTLPPPVHVEQVVADGQTFDEARGLRLPPNVRTLLINYTALSMVAPEKVYFRYKLEGQDLEWREAVNKRDVQYSNLSPGNYLFRVAASNNSGVWNEAGAALAFTIAPAYYETTWFRALYVAAFLALLAGVYELRIRQVQLRWRREQQRRHLERLETEIAEARAFQQSLLPDREALVNGLAICCRYMPCTGVGGDLYDYAAAKPGQTAVLIADVSGHGMSAAMLTGIVKSAFHASHVDGYEPLAVVQRVFSALAAFSPERFVTLFAALVAPDKRELRYVNAGHPPSLLWRGLRDFTWLESTGPLVSPALPASAWEVLVVPIDQYDQLLLYTDGVSEVLAEADGGGETRIRTTVERDWAGGARLLDSILADVQHDLAGRPQPDDLTLLTVRLLPR